VLASSGSEDSDELVAGAAESLHLSAFTRLRLAEGGPQPEVVHRLDVRSISSRPPIATTARPS
jgi:hypothetical protein